QQDLCPGHLDQLQQERECHDGEECQGRAVHPDSRQVLLHWTVSFDALVGTAEGAGSSRRTSMTWPVRSESRTSREVRATRSALSRLSAGSSPKARVRIGVWVRSGLMQLMRTPFSDHSSARA